MNFIRIMVVLPMLLAFTVLTSGLVSFPRYSSLGTIIYISYWSLIAWPMFLRRSRLPSQASHLRVNSVRLAYGLAIGLIGCALLISATFASEGMAAANARIASGGIAEARAELVYERVSGWDYYLGSMFIAVGIVGCAIGGYFYKQLSTVTKWLIFAFILSAAICSAARFGRMLFVVVSLFFAVSFLLNPRNLTRFVRIGFMFSFISISLGLFALGVWRESSSVDQQRSLEREMYISSGLHLGEIGSLLPKNLQDTSLLLGHYFIAPYVGIGLVVESFPDLSGTETGFNHFSVVIRRFKDFSEIADNGESLNLVINWSPRIWLTALRGILSDFNWLGAGVFCAFFGAIGYLCLKFRERNPGLILCATYYCVYLILFFMVPLTYENHMQIVMFAGGAMVFTRGFPFVKYENGKN